MSTKVVSGQSRDGQERVATVEDHAGITPASDSLLCPERRTVGTDEGWGVVHCAEASDETPAGTSNIGDER
jgi:hypothetical protein